jgi:hypothetical protein
MSLSGLGIRCTRWRWQVNEPGFFCGGDVANLPQLTEDFLE